MRIVDLSVALEDNPGEPVRPQVAFEDHDATAPLVAGIFGCPVEELPDSKGWAIEKLHDLGALPAAPGFTVSCLPANIAGASAGWCRAVAILADAA